MTAHRTWRVALAASLVALAATACSKGAGDPMTRTECQGEVCVRVVGQGRSLGDVIGYFAPSSAVGGRSWRLMLTAFGCNPDEDGTCRPSADYPARRRVGNPPRYATCTSTATGIAAAGVAMPACPSYLASAFATHGDWHRFYDLTARPHIFAHATWLCVSVQFDVADHWEDAMQPGHSAPTRACLAVGA